MRRFLLVALCGVALSGCAFQHVEHREIDGVDCAVVVNNLSGNESQPNCNWPDR